MIPATWYVVAGDASDYYWRVTAPARAIGARACMIPQKGGLYAVCEPNDDSAFPWHFDESRDSGFISYPEHEGAAVWTRPDLLRAIHARAMAKEHGIRTVSESDDNYMSDPKFNIYMKSNGFGDDHRLKHLQAMASHDACVFSTEYLRDAYFAAFKEALDRRHVPSELYVVENHVFLEDWPKRVESEGPVRVGWMGSPSHIWDVDLAWPALLGASRAGAQVKMIGYDPANPEHEVTSRRSMDKIKQWRKVNHEFINWVQMDWNSRLRLPLDIGLAPLRTDSFTLAKSDIKAIEYTIAGAAVIASNMPVYNKHWVHGETALLAGSPSEMLDYTLLLMHDESLRQRLVENAQQYVREERDLNERAHEWYEAVTGLPAPPALRNVKELVA